MIDPVSGSIAVTSLQGMQKAESQVYTAAARIAAWPDTSDTVDLSAEMVAMMSARDNFMANVEAAKTGDEMQRALLNLVA